MSPVRLAKSASSRSAVGVKSAGDGGGQGKTVMPQQDEDQLQVLRKRVETLQADLSRRQESYIRRERAFNMRIEELEEEVVSLKGNPNMDSLKSMHQQILHNVEMVQDRSSKILQEQERDLLRAFRARLFDVQTELEREKSRKDGGDSAWIERTRQTEAELDWAKEMADRLDRVNQGLSNENTRLKSQFKSQEDDRRFLIKQLVAIKKENQSLRQEREAAEASMAEIQQKAVLASENMAMAMRTQTRPTSSSSAPNLPGLAISRQAGVDADGRYKEIIKRLKRLLETERRNLRQVRASYAAELKGRTELENLLREAVEEVKEEIAAKRKRAAKLGSGEKGRMGSSKDTLSPVGSFHGARGNFEGSVDSFSTRDREQTLEMLLSRERVLSLLYSKARQRQRNVPSQKATISSISSTASDQSELPRRPNRATQTFPLSPPPHENADGGDANGRGEGGITGAGAGGGGKNVAGEIAT